jgi:hypothetical protein
MNDFLAHIVRRSQHPDLSLRPRATSLFEPEAPFAPPATPAVSDFAERERDEHHVVVRTERPSTPALQAPGQDRPREGAPPAMHEEGRGARVPDVGLARPEQPNPRLPSAPREQPAAVAPPRRDSAPQPRTSRRDEGSAKELPKPAEQPAFDAAPGRPVPAPTPGPERASTAGAPAQRVSLRMPLQREPVWPGPLVIAAMQRADPVPRRVSGAATSQPEPAIQVSIGRVEVRAVPAERTGPRQERPSPVMSLEDYLAGRGGRGRR